MPNINSLLASKSFCILPWISLTISPKGDITPCCINQVKLLDGSQIPQNSHDVLNHVSIRLLRRMMLIGKLPGECEQCSVAGKKTLREIKNDDLVPLLSAEDIARIESTHTNGAIDDPKIRYVDIRPSNICNLKCRTCSPEFSSRIQQEEKAVISFQKPFKLSNHPELIGDLREIYFAGGEPLIDEEHYKSLRLIPPDVTLIYNTNFTQTSYKTQSIFDLWKNRENLSVGVSLDDIGDRLAYLRHGSDYTEIVNNFSKFHNLIPNSYEKIKISITVSIFNILFLGEIIDDFVEKRLVDPDKISIKFLHFPSYFRCNNFKELIGEARDVAVKEIKIEGLRNQVENFLRENTNDESDPSVFLEKVKDKDRIRNEKFEETYPKLAKFFI